MEKGKKGPYLEEEAEMHLYTTLSTPSLIQSPFSTFTRRDFLRIQNSLNPNLPEMSSIRYKSRENWMKELIGERGANGVNKTNLEHKILYGRLLFKQYTLCSCSITFLDLCIVPVPKNIISIFQQFRLMKVSSPQKLLLQHAAHTVQQGISHCYCYWTVSCFREDTLNS